MAEAVADTQGGVTALTNLVHLACEQGDTRRAATLYVQGLGWCRSVGEQSGVGPCLEGLGRMAAMLGSARQAVWLLGAAEAWRPDAVRGVPRVRPSPDDGAVARLRSTLGEEEFVRAWTEGQAMTVAQVIAAALEETTET
ncbi:MAG: hypothetical protein NVSMB65_22370 [Chloroflexota bacterium]